jgi:hypothetical protein
MPQVRSLQGGSLPGKDDFAPQFCFLTVLTRSYALMSSSLLPLPPMALSLVTTAYRLISLTHFHQTSVSRMEQW